MGPPGYFQPEWNQPSAMYRGPVHQKRTRFNEDTIRGIQSPVRQVSGRNSTGRGLTWVRKPVKELGEGQLAGVAENNSGREGTAELKDNSV